MAIPTFSQSSRANEVIYQIRDGYLEVRARPLLGKFSQYRIELRTLDPNYQPRITRDYALLLALLLMAGLFAAAIWGLLIPIAR